MTTPDTVYYGKRADMIREVGGSVHIYPGAYLIYPMGPVPYDAEGADTLKDMQSFVADLKRLWPDARFVRI
jgi:hypothetical protein